MKSIIKRVLYKIRKYLGIDSIPMLLGKLCIEAQKNVRDIGSLDKVEFKVFSQWGEDGIIQYLIRNIEIPNKIFIEFGVGDYTEASTRFLLINDNWSGLVMDSSKSNISFIKKDDIFWRHDLKAIHSFITRDNICQLIAENIKEKDIGLLAIDIDGNDYWVWKAITMIRPRIVICEYNGILGCEHPVTIPYDPQFNRTKKHYSNLYWGSSLPALCLLAEEKDYVFVGCNSGGNNAFFIRKDICTVSPIDCKKGFVMPKFRESRSRDYQCTYLGSEDRIRAIYGMEIFDIKSKRTLLVKDIFK